MHTRLCTEHSPSCAVVTTLIGLCNCLAKHCGKQPIQICPFASNHFLNMDSHRHDSAIQEIAEHVWICVSERLSVCYSVMARMCMCFYGSFKGSECGGLPFHPMSAVVQLWSTARPYIWNTENTPGVLAPTVFWTHLSSVCVYVCILGAHLCVCTCNSAPLCCTLCP